MEQFTLGGTHLSESRGKEEHVNNRAALCLKMRIHKDVHGKWS